MSIRKKWMVILAMAAIISMQVQSQPKDSANPRHALVIGNSSYTGMPALVNPENDATDVAAALEVLGFDVSLVLDGNRRTMNQAINVFREALSRDRSSEGLFYYAGHGIQSKGQNFLIPVGAEILGTADLEDEAVSLSKILSSLEEAYNRVNLVVLDACRDNPLPAAVRSSSRGLSAVNSAPPETLILYSTGAGQTASDGQGRNSPFAAAFLAHLGDPGDITVMTKRITADVKGSTGGAQIPYIYMGLSVDFELNPGSIATLPVLTAPTSATTFAGAMRPQEGTATAQARAAYGAVEIVTVSEGSLYIDGNEMTRLKSGASLRLDRLDTGKHRFELRYDNGSVEVSEMSVLVNGTIRVGFSMVPKPKRSDRFVSVEGGEFIMGDRQATKSETDDEPAHRVRLDSFLMAKFETTHAEYEAVMGKDNRARQGLGKPEYAEVSAGWYDAIKYCNLVSMEEGLQTCYSIGDFGADPATWPPFDKNILQFEVYCDWEADGYRLPTEAEWEYAARGGALSRGYRYAGSDDPKAISSILTTLSNCTIGKKQPNELGLHDMANLVWEWCWDKYDPEYYRYSRWENPHGPDAYVLHVAVQDTNADERSKPWVSSVKISDKPGRILRGGVLALEYSREVWYRNAEYPVYSILTSLFKGFRLVRSLR